MTIAMKEKLDLGVATPMTRMVEWRFVWITSGVQYVMMAGMLEMLPQCVDNWDTVTLVTMRVWYKNKQ